MLFRSTIERSPCVCGDHGAGDEFCEHCKHRFAVSVDVVCTNCPFTTKSPYPTHALGNVDLMSFMTGHGIDPFASDAFHLRSCTEELLSTDPLEARYTFSADGDAFTLTVNGELSVVETSRSRAPNVEEGA